ncbi:RCC1 domain-containing protein [Microbacterium laevaniformans]|uniref:RCC1 domain-containing protein n=1 Tax=Microbacterium laevaniformans TaxID=36807 RepID=UPI003D9572DE
MKIARIASASAFAVLLALGTSVSSASFVASVSGPSASIATGTVPALTGAAASRDADALTRVRWDALPGEHVDVVRSVGDDTTVITPDIVNGEYDDDLSTTPVRKVSIDELNAGLQSTYAIAGGSLFAWGANAFGQLGTGTRDHALTPVPVDGGALAATTVTGVSAGERHTCVVTADGGTACMGAGVDGQLGDGAASDSTLPVAVDRSMMGGRAVTQVASGRYHSCAIADGMVFCWGTAISSGYLSSSTPILAEATLPSPVTSIAAGEGMTCAIAGGELYCWGQNGLGQLGDGSTTARWSAGDPVSLPRPVTAVAASLWSVCAIAAGDLYCWGTRLGSTPWSSGAAVSSPVSVPELPHPVASVDLETSPSSRQRICAVAAEKLYCWGDGAGSSWGDGSSSPGRADPTVSLPEAPARLAVSGSTTCVAYDTLRCWGRASEAGARSGDRVLLAPVDLDTASFPGSLSCPISWVLTVADRCAPGAGVPVSYTLTRRVAGWSGPAISVPVPLE